ncbi:thioredoxin domain-containing protein plp1 [Strongylocentrotus purpuratus]|uniref:Phosducin domain-containing protein n=1 Tax=Strongylocentrotus purpuratus TaxID=7668 RepID=A0A7M7RDD9_STRPU|nr:thioredoxin domain-containing protein plp1 [Strongylocentrotus purpuratus]|eukprot:XP_790088.1 PREDICTED: thioredoxin domain-containing protein plp1 [Strongylocentrotus purpuratus]
MDTDAGEASGSGYVGRDTEKDCDDGFVDEDELFDELENEDIPANIREARIGQMKREAAAARAMEDKGLGLYTEIEKEEDLLKMTTTIPKVIVHFYKTDFRRCCIMDKHLKILAEQYRDVKFSKVCVDIVPFFVTRLQIQVLPAVLLFIDGVVADRVVGFDELGNTDNFTTDTLENRIAKSEIIKPLNAAGSANKTIFGFDRRRDDSSDEDY